MPPVPSLRWTRKRACVSIESSAGPGDGSTTPIRVILTISVGVGTWGCLPHASFPEHYKETPRQPADDVRNRQLADGRCHLYVSWRPMQRTERLFALAEYLRG